MEALKRAGVKQIDHLVLTHYHGDHFGSMPELSKLIPIKHFYDHGRTVKRPSRQPPSRRCTRNRRQGRAHGREAGRQIALAGTDCTVVTGAGKC